MDLHSKGWRQAAYQAGNVVCTRYSTEALPSEDRLRSDLTRYLALYQRAIAVRPEWALAGRAAQQLKALSPEAGFKPQNQDDYLVNIPAHTQPKSRRHGKMINEYSAWIRTKGYRPSTTEFPKDLVLRGHGREYLLEAKVLYNGKAKTAVREALGQLFEYSYLLDGHKDPRPSMVALFSESVGQLFVDYLETLGVASIWREHGEWRGSPTAVAASVAV